MYSVCSYICLHITDKKKIVHGLVYNLLGVICRQHTHSKQVDTR